MLEGFGGHLVGEQFVEQQLAGKAPDAEALAFLTRLRLWRDRQSSMGPASSEHGIFEGGAASLTAALGFHTVDDAEALAPGQLATCVRAANGAVALVVTRWGEPLGPLTRVALREAATRGMDWCLLFSGTHLRILHAARPSSRRYTEIDLDAAADSEQTGLSLWLLASASALVGGSSPTSAAALVAASDRHGAQVCRSLRAGVLAASGRVAGALMERAARAALDDAFGQALTLVYRVLFLFFAEARGLVPLWHPIYRDRYSVQRLCDLAADPKARGIWDSLQAVGRLAHSGCHAGTLRVTAYNGRLFAPATAPLVDLPHLSEDAARDTLVSLSTRPAPDGEGRQRIAYRDLGVEQLGAVYETLLDYVPEVTRKPQRGRARPATTVTLRTGSGHAKAHGQLLHP